MKNYIFYSLCLIILLGFSSKNLLKAQSSIVFETGLVQTGYNEVRIPGNGGTYFSLKDDLNPESKLFYRVRFSHTFNTKHTLSALYAPLLVKSEGEFTKDVLFEGVSFPANAEITGTYKFNSYRLTYRYEWIQKANFNFGIGLTLKVRDARIALESGLLSSEKTDLGLVPIINFRMMWEYNQHIGLLIEGDALAVKYGRAEDVLLAATFNLSERLSLRTGYRILEGGSNGDAVYNFALFHYASVGISYVF